MLQKNYNCFRRRCCVILIDKCVYVSSRREKKVSRTRQRKSDVILSNSLAYFSVCMSVGLYTNGRVDVLNARYLPEDPVRSIAFKCLAFTIVIVNRPAVGK